ncbi:MULTISPECIES: ABC transporter ATP-binding protein [unclassified Granulicatella]|uniref:ABC transporter ATP-binding protein n=1 Tax=unclassified Granulicatella TaxID=2630493 RepID=UPI0010739DA8|nr:MULTISPECIES: ABC transporter ATP-binding protein [unclassified Granulicatella]MBF0779707.1 ABC transporter ATP-binding protein [Granulicatella sp. 19428wC4_WM01]TFU96228.1 ABC transporter ATP-binding protein [Granulicatella sp. WM01]
MVLNIEHVTGGYTLMPVIKDISMSVNSGELVALIGLNGAGKSTTLKHIMGMMMPHSGQITVNHIPLGQQLDDYRQHIAYIPETPLLYHELTLKEHIELNALAHHMSVEEGLKNAEPFLKTFHLWDKLDWSPAYFSKGMKQKVMIICAFMLEASLYIIDEPFLGLDPLAIRDFLVMIEDKKQKGSGILMSTHVLSTAERKCDRFILMHEGTIRAEGNLEQLRQQFNMPEATLDDIYICMAELAV